MILICNMTDDIMAKLKKQILYVKKLCFKNKVPYSKDMPLFVDDSLNPIKLDLFTKRFAYIRDFYNWPKNITLHSIRHTLATMLAEDDISPKKIQARLGHASAAFTMQVYTSNTDKMQKVVADDIKDAMAKW